MKTDYYELLEVASDASDVQLKKAYRRKALQLHPDKNPHDIEGATAQFALIRAAYEVLSDPQERSWYDSHKNQILNDEDFYIDEDQLIIPSISTEELLKYFNPTFYTKLDDSMNGFYYTVSRLFERLASEEVTHGRAANIDGFDKYQDSCTNLDTLSDATLLYPRFGNSKSDYVSEVRDFYSAWSAFQSVKLFNWRDEYRYSTAPDRKTRRLMEKENKKLRDAARKDFNETVRRYVQFIKKRDPRVKEGIKRLEKEKKLQRQKDMEAQIKKEKGQKLQFEVQDWQKLSLAEIEELEAILDEEFHSSSDSEFDDFQNPEEDELYECIICDKAFKSEKQFEIHENSTKHKKAVKRMQWEMRKEGIELGIDNEEEAFETASDGEGDPVASDVAASDEAHVSDGNAEALAEANDQTKAPPPLSPEFSYEVDDEIVTDEDVPSPQSRPNGFKKDEPEDESEDELTKLSKNIEKGVKLDSDDEDWEIGSKKKKKTKKNTNRSRADSPVSATPPPSGTGAQSPVASGSETCASCSQKFTSRNKLFQHVKDSGHAAPVKIGKKNKKKR